jgi:riboflavin kinase / FMN adenylyltransferase
LKTYTRIEPGLLKRSSLALGFFDGVHLGHQSVIKKAIEQAHLHDATPALITFKDHPRAITLGKSPPLLTMPEARLALCAELGIEAALLLSFTEELCNLSAEDYVEQVLLACMGGCSLSVGCNHRFGHDRVGTPELLKEMGKARGFDVHVAPEIMLEGSPVSSSRIRHSLSHDNPEFAQRLLGRSYSVTGVVVKGDGRGRSIGFPTANTATPPELIVPRQGVYSGTCRLENGRDYPCVINIGLRPTFGKHETPRTEVHIFDFEADIYGEQLTVQFLHFIRKEQQFGSVDELKTQILKDCAQARQQLSSIRQAAAPI